MSSRKLCVRIRSYGENGWPSERVKNWLPPRWAVTARGQPDCSEHACTVIDRPQTLRRQDRSACITQTQIFIILFYTVFIVSQSHRNIGKFRKQFRRWNALQQHMGGKRLPVPVVVDDEFRLEKRYDHTSWFLKNATNILSFVSRHKNQGLQFMEVLIVVLRQMLVELHT